MSISSQSSAKCGHRIQRDTERDRSETEGDRADSPFSQNWETFLSEATKAAIEDNSSKSQARKWHTPLFGFARFLKAHPKFGQLNTKKLLKKIEATVEHWNDPVSGWNFWERFFGMKRHDAHVEIMHVWDRIRLIPGQSGRPLENALAFSQRCPLAVGDELHEKRGHNSKYDEFMSLCAWLQVTMASDSIAVPCREFADALDVEKMTVSRFRKWAVADGLMVLVAEHEFHGPAARNKATRFHVHTELWPVLAERSS